tara:strand:- start:3100 stop:4068 length:969 start_codon:yes stop_codon:yes gene_type:complete
MPVLKNGSRGDSVVCLQEGLAFLGFHPGPADGIFGRGTEHALTEFQSKNRILADGIFGPSTCAVYNGSLSGDGLSYKVDLNPFSAKHAITSNDGDLLSWIRCPADKFEDRGGYTRTTLRSDVAEAYNKLYAEINALGGIITSAGGRRGISKKAGASMSKKSMHYVGRAFDMALPTGMQNPAKDPFVVCRDPEGNGRKWVVWCKTDNPDVPEVTLEGTYVTSRKNSKGKRYTLLKTKSVTCRAFNFTEVAKKHGFERISARRSFFNGGSYSGAEWWHFQYENGLIRSESTFGQELLKVYTLEQASSFIYWDEAKNCSWQVNWF